MSEISQLEVSSFGSGSLKDVEEKRKGDVKRDEGDGGLTPTAK